MLLRSSSTPIMNSRIPETDRAPKLNRTRSVSLTGTYHVNLNQSPNEELTLTRSPSETDHSVAKKKLLFDTGNPIPLSNLGRFSTTGLGTGEGSRAVVGRSDGGLQSLILGGISSGNGGGGGGDIFSGGGGGRGSNGGDGSESFDDDGNSNHGNESADAYYQKMINANPGNALLLGNYAKFLKEVRGDSAKAEEYCGRAILANPSDGNVLSMYGGLIWENQRDAERAETYFDQAVKTAPDDSYVLASYARFLWDAEEEDEDEEDQLEIKRSKVSSHPEAATAITIT